MPQINSGKSPPWVSGEIVTAAGLNGMIDSATITPSVISDQSYLTFPNADPADEILVLQQPSGLLKRTSLADVFLSGNLSFSTGSITGNTTGVFNIFNLYGRIHQSANTYVKIDASNGASNGNNAIELESVNVNGNIKINAGTNNLILQATNLTFDGKASFNTTGAIKLPVGTTAQRPATPVAGDTRFNSTLATQETYDGTQWTTDAIKVAVLTRELTSGSIQINTGFNWDDIEYNTINQTAPFVVNAASFTGVPSSAGTSTITLPAGTYTIDAEASIQSNAGSGAVTARVYNATSSSVIKTGITSYCANYSHGTSIVYAAFTLATQSDIVIQFYQTAGTAAPSTTNGITPAVQEVVYIAKITKLS